MLPLRTNEQHKKMFLLPLSFSLKYFGEVGMVLNSIFDDSIAILLQVVRSPKTDGGKVSKKFKKIQ